MSNFCIVCGRPKVGAKFKTFGDFKNAVETDPTKFAEGEGDHLCWASSDDMCDAADALEELAKLRELERAVARLYKAAIAFPEKPPEGMEGGYISTVASELATQMLLDLFAKQKADAQS
jgi:hypothetical protein